MSRIVATRPNHDVTTNYLYFWTGVVLHLSHAVDLRAKRANREEFTSIIGKIKPSLIVINGHGSSRAVFGHDDAVLIETGDNHEILKETITVCRSCQSAQVLGQKAVDSGCKAFIGYNEDFVFIIESDKISRPLSDKTAGYFLEPSNQVIISLLKGHSAGESNIRSREMFRRNIQKLSTSAASTEDSEMIPYLLWDLTHQVCIGDEEATV